MPPPKPFCAAAVCAPVASRVTFTSALWKVWLPESWSSVA
jgi:hypothetical protein